MARVPIPENRIVGGEDANIEDLPWQVSMVYFGSHRCGGSIVSPTFAVTAAHCTIGTVAASTQLRAGSSLRLSGGTLYQVASFTNHPDYNDNTLSFDLAIFELATPFEYADGIQPIALPYENEEISAGAEATISGWGTLSEGGSSPNQLQVVRVPVVPNSVCNALYSVQGWIIEDNMLCAGNIEAGGQDACQGDSGGPLVVNNTLSGAVSWGLGCARPNFPGVYARVAFMRVWVSEIIGF